MADIRPKRIYDDAEESDGVRVLVDRIWPRGVSKEDADIDLWLKEVAPSTDLRKWFGHDPQRWDWFKKRYFKELDERDEAIAELIKLLQKGRVTLVYAAKDREHNQAVALVEYLEALKRSGRG